MLFMNNEMIFLLKEIRSKRVQLSYKQDYMAFKMSSSQNAYSKIELGVSKLTVLQLVKICQILDLDIGKLLAPLMKAA